LEHPFHKFDDPSQKVLVVATNRAYKNGDLYIGAEHILLGLLTIEKDSVAYKILSRFKFNMEPMDEIPKRPIFENMAGFQPNEAVRRIIHYVMQWRDTFGDKTTGTEHLLLALAQERSGISAKILEKAEIDLEKVHAEVEKIRGQTLPFTPIYKAENLFADIMKEEKNAKTNLDKEVS
jgi:ATP-dependent Clp protease ATP-binding subunit ClpC